MTAVPGCTSRNAVCAVLFDQLADGDNEVRDGFFRFSSASRSSVISLSSAASHSE
jgi:hypothetical protein